MKEMEVNAEFLRFLGDLVDRYHWNLRKMLNLSEAFRKGKKEWADLLTRTDEWYLESVSDPNSRRCGELDKAQDALMQWMSKFDDWDDLETEVTTQLLQKPKLLANIPLLGCSWCSRPSAALKKRGGCGKEKWVVSHD